MSLVEERNRPAAERVAPVSVNSNSTTQTIPRQSNRSGRAAGGY